MHFFRKKHGPDVPGWAAAALIISTLAFAAAAGVARWSWLVVEEQIQLRKDFMELKNSQEQTNIQYEFWLDKLKTEREAGRQK